ncbi:MAG TPA: hypothetical protein VJ464_16920 [Blastocatellia bacterium]|nr:hypothetical protein [Blastocatellia bacterium]
MRAEYQRRASGLFWLGLGITALGCFFDLAMQSDGLMSVDGASLAAVGQAFVGLLFGVLLPIAKIYETTQLSKAPGVALVSGAILFVASGVLVSACRAFARGKGYGVGLGYLGLLGLAGVVVLMFFPDRTAPARGPAR